MMSKNDSLSELVDPTREKYKLATSIAMGKSMNSVIVDTKIRMFYCYYQTFFNLFLNYFVIS